MSDGQTAQWQATINLEDLWEGEMEPVDVAGHRVLLVNVDGRVRAYDNRCPHQASALHEGDFDGGTITCASHLWEFDADSGRGINPGTAHLTAFPCQVADDGTILVDVGR